MYRGVVALSDNPLNEKSEKKRKKSIISIDLPSNL